jgi:hypothetical protein
MDILLHFFFEMGKQSLKFIGDCCPQDPANETGEKLAFGKLHVIQYQMLLDENGTKKGSSFAAFLNCDSVNVPIVGSRKLAPRVFSIPIGGTVFRVYLPDATPDDLVEVFEVVLRHFATGESMPAMRMHPHAPPPPHTPIARCNKISKQG